MAISVLLFSVLYFGLFYYQEKIIKWFSFSLVTLNSFLLGLILYQQFFEELHFNNLSQIFFLPNSGMFLLAMLVTTLFCIPVVCEYLLTSLTKIHIVHRYEEKTTRQANILRISLFILAFIVIFIGFLFLSSCYWALNYFGELDINQIFYTLSQPLGGGSANQMESFIFGPLLISGLISSLVWTILYFMVRYKLISPAGKEQQSRPFWRFLIIPASLILTIGNLFLGVSAFGLENVKSALFDKSTIYEDYYINPADVEITFPENKHNLIYIYLESMETTYTASQYGGAQTENYIPNLTSLALDNINFSNTDLLGGSLTLPGMNFTAGALVAQTSGTPVITSVQPEDYGAGTDSYLPGVYSLGEVLESEGYRNVFMLGSEASFSGRDKYFSQHGNYEIMDINYAKDAGWLPEDYFIWWGYEDQTLLNFAKNVVDELGEADELFNFTLLTADTHFPDGLMTVATPELYDSQYGNVIHWSDEMVVDFIDHIKEQDYFDDTTIIISGDHLSMDTTFFEDLDTTYTRTVYNTIINPAVTISEADTKNRQFSNLDMYPTTLAALGATIAGERLGLGTNLFSGEQTLVEELGYDTMYSELQMRSSYYSKVLMGGTDTEVFISQSGVQ